MPKIINEQAHRSFIKRPAIKTDAIINTKSGAIPKELISVGRKSIRGAICNNPQ
jgi:hypothetical protein